MIRKSIIVLLTLGAVGTVVASIVCKNLTAVYATGPVFYGIGIGRGMLGIGVSQQLDASASLRPSTLVTSHHYQPWAWLPECRSSTDGWSVGIPFWLLFVLLALYPTLAFIRGPLRRRRRRRKGLCVACGYDLTGNVSGVCPECGTEARIR
jgi:hypothetical protein